MRILLSLGLVKEAVKIYVVEGYLSNALLLIELKFSNGDESHEVPITHLVESLQQNTRAPYQQQAKLGLHLNTDLLTKKGRTLTPITKEYKNPWASQVLEAIKED